MRMWGLTIGSALTVPKRDYETRNDGIIWGQNAKEAEGKGLPDRQ